MSSYRIASPKLSITSLEAEQIDEFHFKSEVKSSHGGSRLLQVQ